MSICVHYALWWYIQMLRQLEVGLLALFRLQSDTQLHQKVIEGIYEVVNEVELVVVHVPG